MLEEVLVVSHTHWDREWYRSADVFKHRLIAVIDELIDDPPPEGGSFLLDGQGILLDDYLAVRPERAAELSALIRDGRIEAGPWYVLADELIPSGEALVRNLLAGRSAVRRLRGEPPPVLYCPDSFGHPAILPDLALGFGLSIVVLWRGLGGTSHPAVDTMRWRTKGGASVIVYHLPPDGYELGSSLPLDDEHAHVRWNRIRDVMSPRAVTGTAILLNGADHHARQRDLSAALGAMAMVARPVRLRSTALREAAHHIVEAAAGNTLEHLSGELRDSYGHTWTLQGTLGTRAYQKRANACAERSLVRDVEPWLAVSQLLERTPGSGTSNAVLNAAWKALLSAQPHDTLCGTSIDRVAEAFDETMKVVGDRAVALQIDAIATIIGHDGEDARARPHAWRPALVLRNPAPRPRSGVAELMLSATLAHVAVGPGSGDHQGPRVEPPPWGVDGVPLQIIAQSEAVELTEAPRAYPKADRVVTARAVGWIAGMTGYSVATHLHGAKCRAQIPYPVRVEKDALENGRIRVVVAANGFISLTDIALNRTIVNLLGFENQRDEGDLYTPAIRKTIRPLRFRRSSVVHRGPLRGQLQLTYRTLGSSVRRADVCRVVLQLDAGASALRVIVSGENRSNDHRLRLRMNTGLPRSRTLADAAFFPVWREPIRAAKTAGAMEKIVPTAPLHRWVARTSADGQVALCSDGLAEYESLADGSIAVTLVRAVGELSRADLPERPGHAGWPASTPGAQCIGPFNATFGVQCFHASGAWLIEQVNAFADDVLLPIRGETLRSNILDGSESGSLELRGAGLTFSAAAPARERGWTMLRCVNQGDENVRGEWKLPSIVSEAQKTRLDETPLEPADVEGDTVSFSAAPFEIVTILVR